jgi:hypothetical protein
MLLIAFQGFWFVGAILTRLLINDCGTTKTVCVPNAQGHIAIHVLAA